MPKVLLSFGTTSPEISVKLKFGALDSDLGPRTHIYVTDKCASGKPW